VCGQWTVVGDIYCESLSVAWREYLEEQSGKTRPGCAMLDQWQLRCGRLIQTPTAACVGIRRGHAWPGRYLQVIEIIWAGIICRFFLRKDQYNPQSLVGTAARVRAQVGDCCKMDALTAFGLFAVTAMMVCYALEQKNRWFVFGFALSCGLGSVYGFLQGAWPFGVVEAVWMFVALRRWMRYKRN
jgi:hypothetical protein